MRMRWLARRLYPRLRVWALARKPDFRVVQDGGKVYLKRWHIVRPRWWRSGLYLHQMLLDDDAVLHDHPYWSMSLCLADGLWERYVVAPQRTHEELRDTDTGHELGVSDLAGWQRRPRAGDLVFRSSRLAHQLKVLPGTEPWTLFFTGPRLPKEWGFWCRRGWVHFKEYANIAPSAAGAGTGSSGIGRGCGEG